MSQASAQSAAHPTQFDLLSDEKGNPNDVCSSPAITDCFVNGNLDFDALLAQFIVSSWAVWLAF